MPKRSTFDGMVDRENVGMEEDVVDNNESSLPTGQTGDSQIRYRRINRRRRGSLCFY